MKIVNLDFGTFQFFPDVVIGDIAEGIHFDHKLNSILKSIALEYYGDHHPVGYISLRNNVYSIDPMVHHENKSYEQLTAIAIVQHQHTKAASIEFEAKFFRDGKLKAFYTAEEALVWVSSQT